MSQAVGFGSERRLGRRIGRRFWIVLALALLVLLLGGPALRANLKPRAALYYVIRACVMMQDTLGTPFPCLSVDPASAGTPGYAVLRAPGNPTHVITTPLVPIAGIENEELLQPDAGVYWRAALMSRRYVEAGADGPVPPGDVGLAINSRRTRSQDQLHIHAECLGRPVLAAVRAESFAPGDGWQPLRRPVDDDSFVGRLVERREIEGGNLFAVLASLPNGAGNDMRSDMGDVASLVVPVAADGTGDSFVLIASRVRRRSIERLLDESCSVASRG